MKTASLRSSVFFKNFFSEPYLTLNELIVILIFGHFFKNSPQKTLRPRPIRLKYPFFEYTLPSANAPKTKSHAIRRTRSSANNDFNPRSPPPPPQPRSESPRGGHHPPYARPHEETPQPTRRKPTAQQEGSTKLHSSPKRPSSLGDSSTARPMRGYATGHG